MNAKTGLILAAVGLFAGQYAYVHDLISGKSTIWMGPISWTIAVISFLVAVFGLWLIWREAQDKSE